MRTDIFWGFAIGCGTAALLWVAYQPQERSFYTSLGAMFWPRIVLWGLLLLSVLLVGMGWYHHIRPVAAPQPERRLSHLRQPLVLAVTGSAYFASLNFLGFLLATLVFTAASVAILGRRAWLEITVFSVTVTGIVWLVFIKVLNVPLPKGVGIFHQLSLLFI